MMTTDCHLIPPGYKQQSVCVVSQLLSADWINRSGYFDPLSGDHCHDCFRMLN